MNILQLTKKFVAPVKDGESLAIVSLSQGLQKEGCQVNLLAINTKKHHSEAKHSHPDLQHYHKVETIDIDTDVKLIDALIHLVKNKSYNISRYKSSQFESALIENLKSNNYDAIIIETLYMLIYTDVIKKYSDAKIIFRSHNLEHEIWSDLAKSNAGLKKYYFNHCSKKLLDFEKEKWGSYDLLVPITDDDHSKYKSLKLETPHVTIPVGLDLEKYKTHFHPNSDIVKLGYIGSLDWKPNIEGLKWFFDNIWKDLKIKFPQLEFHVAGRNLDSSLGIDKIKDVHYHGEVDSAVEFLSALDVVVVPLLSGSGIRVKILESLAMGKLVMATPKALEGIQYTHGINAFKFENTVEMLQNMEDVISASDQIEKVQFSALDLVKNLFGQRQLALKLKAAILKIMK